MHPDIDKILTLLPERQPLTYKAIYPKRITPPGGFLNPKYFSISLWSALRVWEETDMRMIPHITGYVNSLIQMEYRVPTYFVRSEFAQAVAQTEPPADFKFSEIKWPMPAMLFVLPTDFALRYFGYLCPFISVTRSDQGNYPDILKNLPTCETPFRQLEALRSDVDRFNVVYPVYGQQRVPVDYTGSYPLTMNVNEVDAAPFQDATYSEEKQFAAQFGYYTKPSGADLPTGEQEKIFNSKVQAFAIKLMLALTARPNFIVPGSLSRPMKVKKGHIREELWHPNLIGWDYRAQRVATSGDHGTHASPRMHWRRGHMRNQPFGPKPWTETTAKRLTWIEPVLINAPEEI